LLFHGPFPFVRTYVLDSFATTRHAYLLKPLSLFTVSEAEIKAHEPKLTVRSNSLTAMRVGDFPKPKDSRIIISTHQEPTFRAYIMVIDNPNLVQVAVTHDVGVKGQTVSELVMENHAVAGINAGAFEDNTGSGWRGTGGIPLGITMHGGKLIANDHSQWSKQPVIGITDKGALIAGSYSPAQLLDVGVKEAVSFGPVLVQNGTGMVIGNGGWGEAPRTAIGQKADGSMIFIVTDGRGINGPNDIGASLRDIQDLMIANGAVLAVNLDGGSSATMFYDGKLVNQPTDILGERAVATGFIVK